jgi:2-oxo-4-hydroxy-4-carboxy-5-ureidoimidazoline decarboxylase
MTLAELNAPDAGDRFVEALGWVFEHSPWVADRAWLERPFASLDDLCDKMTAQVDAASREEQLALLCAHPDLGTRARVSRASAGEQAGAGLDQLTPDEYESLLRLNTAYKKKFGFPFLYAVKGSDKLAILEALGRRLESAPEEEFQAALGQVYRIARFRLEGIIT